MSSGGNARLTVKSPVLDHIPKYKQPVPGDKIHWRFAAKSEHQHDAKVSLDLIFGERRRAQVQQQPVPGGPVDFVEFSGAYEFTKEDAQEGMPAISLTLSCSDGVRVYVDYFDAWIEDESTQGPRDVKTAVAKDGCQVSWPLSKDSGDRYSIYRSTERRGRYEQIAKDVSKGQFLDKSVVDGITYYYVVTRASDGKESSASEVASARRLDKTKPLPPVILSAKALEAEVKLSWECSSKDVHHYTLLRGTNNSQFRVIADGLTKSKYLDFTPDKGVNQYKVRAVDYSGNASEPSKAVKATTKAVLGASFRDLIKPMPVGDGLRSDVWGAANVIPRNPDNGIEHPKWSYWGGHPITDKDGKHHLVVCRWPEGNIKGHWKWYSSTVVHAVADNPLGPYVPTGEIAYQWENGVGHNPGLTPLNDGTYMLHLRGGHVLTSANIAGPWKYEGVYTVDYNGFDNVAKHNTNQYIANVVGIQRDDGSLLFVSKWGATMVSTKGILGPYVVQSKPVIHTDALPKLYRNVGYEDPAFWKDENQYHMIINGFIARRAVYLRSPDGVHWKFDPGTAYAPEVTSYQDGTRTRWDILERPHVLQDQYGRATHLSLAVLDVYKYDDFANDGHSSKNIMLPLTVHRRIEWIGVDDAAEGGKQFRVLVRSENGFDAQKGIDLSTLRFGASEEVNFGRGLRAIDSKPHQDGAVITFTGTKTGLTEEHFVCKMLGRTTTGELLIGFSKMPDAEALK